MRKLVLYAVIVFGLLSVLPAHGEEQKIKPGSIVLITVLGYSELSMSVHVRSDGSTDYPLLANVPIDGMTVHQLKEVLQPILARFVERPKVFINIAEHYQLEVTVEGQVKNPGQYIVKGPASLQSILAIAGGTTLLANLRDVTIHRSEYDMQRQLKVDLYKFFTGNDTTTLPEIKEGDIIFIPIMSQSTNVRVMGAVRNPGAYIATIDENIADMIAIAGGVNSNGNLNKIVYITKRDGARITNTIELRDLLNKGLTEEIPIVQPGDIIVVTEYSQWQLASWWVDMLRDVAVVFSSLVILSNL